MLAGSHRGFQLLSGSRRVTATSFFSTDPAPVDTPQP